jgi:phage terminase Nu1 subunit (DNA packaging protein)
MNVSLSALSREFGIARETVKKRLMSSGVTSSGREKGNDVYRLGAAARAIVAADYGGQGAEVDPDNMAPRERLDHYKALNEQAKFEEASGQLVQHEDHAEVIADLGKLLIQAIETLPDILERRCRLSADSLAEIERVTDDARVQVAEQLEQYELRKPINSGA